MIANFTAWVYPGALTDISHSLGRPGSARRTRRLVGSTDKDQHESSENFINFIKTHMRNLSCAGAVQTHCTALLLTGTYAHSGIETADMIYCC